MGNIDTKPTKVQADWEKIDTDNGIEIYRNRYNNELAEKRIITIDSEYDIEDEVAIYNMREHNNEALVRTLGTQNLDSDSTASVLCAGQRKVFVFTQKMPHRLSECPQLTFPQSLLFLRQALRAFERLYKEEGPVQITKELIGLNYLGEVKSWLNENWALNHRGHEYLNLGSATVSELTREQYLAFRGEYLDEPQMIRNLISVIQQKCQDGRFPQAFKQEVENQSGSFRKLLLYLKDFIDYNEIYVPERIDYETLARNNYKVRLDYQLGLNHQGGRHAQSQFVNVGNNFVMNQSQQPTQYSIQQGPYSQQSLYPMNGQIGSMGVIKPYLLPSLTDTNKQSPGSDTLGRVTFSQSNRAYSGENKLQGTGQKGTGQTITYSTGGNNYQWSNNLQGVSTASFQHPSVTYGNGSIGNNNIGTTAESKYEFYSPSGYQPYQPSPYQSSLQPLTFDSTLQPSKYESSLNNLNLGNGEVKDNKYSYNYSSSFTGSGNFANYSNQAQLKNYGNQSSSNTYNQQPSLNLPASTYQSNYNYTKSTGYQPSFTPITTKVIAEDNFGRPYTNAGTYEKEQYGQQSVQGQIVQQQVQGKIFQQQDPHSYENHRITSDKVTIIDGRTGEEYVETRKIYQQPNTNGYSNNYQNSASNNAVNKWGEVNHNYTSETYKPIASNIPLQIKQPTNNPSSQTNSTFSFGSKINNQSKFGNSYTGTGYSNNLTKYQPLNNLNIQGKYAQEFTSLISPHLAVNVEEQNTSIINKIQMQTASMNTPINNIEQVYTPKADHNKASLNAQHPSAQRKNSPSQQHGPNNVNRTFEGFSNIVQRESNQITESLLKPF